MVVSLPPCWVAALANTLPTLPTSAPFIQRLPVRSRKFRICAHILPKRVGVPKRRGQLLIAPFARSPARRASTAASQSARRLNSNGNRIACWKCLLERLVEEFIEVRHYGRSKLVGKLSGQHWCDFLGMDLWFVHRGSQAAFEFAEFPAHLSRRASSLSYGQSW